MLFNSYLFIFIFLPLTLFFWYSLNHRRRYTAAKALLTVMSFWFYGYFNPYYLLIMLISIIINYGLSHYLQTVSTTIKRRLGLFAGILFNLGLLFYFKYYDFFIENINQLFSRDFNLKHILLPLGISFFTFQQLSYLIDRYKKKALHCSLLDYAAFVSFFPQLVAGPIVLHEELLPQLAEHPFPTNPNRKRFNPTVFAQGITLFVLGLAKKVLLADNLALAVNHGYNNAHLLDTTSTLLVVLAYTFELYFDFSGYCDMAIGLGKMFNIKLPINFNSPYHATSVKELWGRWHMTLTRFFTTYLYIPLGGNRHGFAQTARNTMIVFSLSGLWHGADWTFVIWGILQGIMVVWDHLGLVAVRAKDSPIHNKPAENTRINNNHAKNALLSIPRWLGWFCTFSFFNLSFIFFRSPDLTIARQMWKNLFSFQNSGYLYKLVAQIDLPEFYILRQFVDLTAPQLLNHLNLAIFLLLLVISAFIIGRWRTALTIAEQTPLSSRFCWYIALLFAWSIISFSQVSTFIYFNF
ncbi:MAG: MBOAT family protein [Lachnospiraceae bacterium]|jgi:alginate O-acetyltransferase complex protein AlgI|nr:MBOAT family protein [Lachnospiraceae bacterium]